MIPEELRKRGHSGHLASGIAEPIIRYFWKNLTAGKKLSLSELRKYAETNRLPVPTAKQYTKIKDAWPEIKKFGEARKRKGDRFQTIVTAPYGSLMMDVGFFPGRDFKRANRGHVGFVLAVEVHTHLLGLVPLKNKTLSDFQDAIKRLLEEGPFSEIVQILSDREAALFSKKFADAVWKRHSIKMRYLKLRSKAYLAERYIRFVKNNLSESMAAAGDKNWIDKATNAVNHFNKMKYPGTDFRRVDVDSKNFDEFMMQKWKISDLATFKNVSSFPGGMFDGVPWKKDLFKFSKGDDVLLTRTLAPHETKGGGGKKFSKPTLRGSYHDRPYTIAHRSLKMTLEKGLTPLYRLKTSDGKKVDGQFYEWELTLIKAAGKRPPTQSY